MRTERIEQTEAFLREKLSSGEYMRANPAALAYRLEHSYRVANLGRQIARAEGFDEEAMTVACLLHDVSYCETFDGEKGWREHGRRAAAIARPFLMSLGMAPERAAEICYGIAIHVDDEADFPGERTPFALTVGDADNLDRFDAYRLYEKLEADGFSALSLEEKTDCAENRLAGFARLRDVQMATETARRIWLERLDFAAQFYEKLLAQLRGSATLL